MWFFHRLLGFFTCFSLLAATIVTDTGCKCALTKSTVTTPNAGSTINVGCSFKTDWNSQNTEWCLTDQTAGLCGTFQPSFGYVDSCVLATIQNVTVMPAPKIEWDQTPYTYYTGQTFNVTWDSVNIQSDEWVRVQYQGSSLRTLTSGSGVNITAKQFAVRLSDASNMVTTGAVPVNLNLPSTPSISTDSLQSITVIQSKLMNIELRNKGSIVASGATLLCDNDNVTVSWRGLGQAQFGLVSISMRSGFGTLVGSAITNLAVYANMSVNYTLPRSFNPNGGSTYTTTISVQEPGQSAYTGTTVGIRLSAAPSTSPTPTPSITPSRTPTPSITPTRTPTPTLSFTSSPSGSPSQTPSNTPSITPTQTPTPSTTPSARPSIDYALIARNAAEAVDTQTPAIAGALGGIGGILVLLGAWKWYERRSLTEKRRKKLAMTSRFVQDRNLLYGIESDSTAVAAPTVVMYTVANMPSKKAFPPKQTS